MRAPRHRASNAAFFLDKTEVTNAQYKKFCDATGYAPPPHWKAGNFPEGQGDFPVTRVNWYEATACANWMGKRLPTESEWERAAGGTEGRLYTWGNTWDASRLVWDTDGPRAVGSKPQGASPEGALDLNGNVLEWDIELVRRLPQCAHQAAGFRHQTQSRAWRRLDGRQRYCGELVSQCQFPARPYRMGRFSLR
jgi:formylglycine-generating enzyme required for sulfatase activity